MLISHAQCSVYSLAYVRDNMIFILFEMAYFTKHNSFHSFANVKISCFFMNSCNSDCSWLLVSWSSAVITLPFPVYPSSCGRLDKAGTYCSWSVLKQRSYSMQGSSMSNLRNYCTLLIKIHLWFALMEKKILFLTRKAMKLACKGAYIQGWAELLYSFLIISLAWEWFNITCNL